MKKERLDVLMVQRNLAESREKAKALIMSGIVYVNGQKEDKAGTSFEETVQIEVRGSTWDMDSLPGSCAMTTESSVWRKQTSGT